ncbi:MAG: ExbD/TolR family protein [Bacteriovoracaceae bacterium]
MRPLRAKKKMEKLNLIPIMDAVFIFIFYLLMSAQFIDIYEIGTDVAKLSTTDQIKKDKIPLNLTVKIFPEKIQLLTGVPSKVYKEFRKDTAGNFPVSNLSTELQALKEKHPTEKTAIVVPATTVTYKELVPVLDSIRAHQGQNQKVVPLFGSISFGEF